MATDERSTRPSAEAIESRLSAFGNLYAAAMALRTARPLGPIASLARDECGRPILRQSWWLRRSAFPALAWLRLSVLGDGSVEDVGEDPTARARFSEETAALDWLSREGCVALHALRAEDAAALGRSLPDLTPPDGA